MSQITLYLDDATQALVEQAAQANGVSKSRWVADIIRKYAAHEWPQDCLALAGRFAEGFGMHQKTVDHLLVVPHVFLEQRVHDNGRGTGVLQMQHRIQIATERRR